LPQATCGYELCIHHADRWTTVKRGRQWPSFVVGMAAAVLFGCSNPAPKIAATLNESASLSGDLPVNPLKWKIITSMVDKKNSTMSTLYGNDVAVEYARTNAQRAYPEGSRLALVTWTEADDQRWFGAKIPGGVKAVEFVFVKLNREGRVSYTYQKYEGSPLKMTSLEQSFTRPREADILLSKRAAVLP
jgi:hypothetical protein